MRRVCIIAGDGVGREVIPAAVTVLRALQSDLEFIEAFAGFDHFLKTGCSIPDDTIALVQQCDATLFGATSSPMTRVEGYRSPILALRQTLDLYANLRPIQSLPGHFSREGIDLLIVRENTEGLYSGRERMDAGTAIAERVITPRASERIARIAFQQAEKRRSRLTIVHKANVLKLTDGVFRQACFETVKDFPNVNVDEMLVDAMAMRLVRDPERFDVLVTTNLFGDILSDEASGLIGGLGVAPSGNIGERNAVFEPAHGSAPDIAGQGIANPIASILSAAMLLDYLHLDDEAEKVRHAVERTFKKRVLTPDLGGNATTEMVTNTVIDNLFASNSND